MSKHILDILPIPDNDKDSLKFLRGNNTWYTAITKDDLASETLTVITPEDSENTNPNQIATVQYVKKSISNLVNGAQDSLDTLKELLNALGDDPHFANTITNTIGTKITKVASAKEGNIPILNSDGSLSDSGKTLGISVPSDAKFTDTITTVTSSGKGNVITSITATNGQLNVIKGETALIASDIENKADKATTLAGYGITDAKIDRGVITLGDKTITPIVDISSKANLNSPALTGTPTAPTAENYNTPTQIATLEYVKNSIGNLINSAPEALDSLKELSDALGNDPNFASNVATELGKKANKATTLSGYNISDANIANGVITLGNNTIKPLTTAYTSGNGNAITSIIPTLDGALNIKKDTTFLVASDITNKADKVIPTKSGNIANLDASGNLVDSKFFMNVPSESDSNKVLTGTGEWKDKTNVVIGGSEFTPDTEISDNIIWVDTEDNEGIIDSVCVNETVNNLITTVNDIKERLEDIEYAFDYEICFGDFTNNVKTEESKGDTEEPLTETTVNEETIVLEDKTVNNIVTTVTSQSFLRSDGNTYTKNVVKTVTTHKRGTDDDTILDVITIIDTNESVINSEDDYTLSSERTVNTKKTTTLTEDTTIKKSDGTDLVTLLSGSVSTEITNKITSSDESKNETTTSTVNVYSKTETEDDNVTTKTTNITTTISDDTYNQVTTIYEIKSEKNNEYKTTKYETTTVLTSKDKTITELKTVLEYSEDGETLTTTETKTVTEYDDINDLTQYIITGPLVTTTSENLNEIDADNKPNAKHLRLKMGLYNDLLDIIESKEIPFLSGELLYCYDKNKLFIVTPSNTITEISGSGSNGSSEADLTNVDEINFNTKLFSTNTDTKYTVKVNKSGNLICYPTANDTHEAEPTNKHVDGVSALSNAQSALYLQKLYINMVYCGGLNSDEYSYNYCDYNFVELSNLTTKDIVLDGLSLQYSNGGTDWYVLPLTGVIKSQSTFLIRGAKCSVSDVNTTIIHVPEPDMYWYNTYSDGSRSLIKFSDVTSKFVLMYGTTSCPVANPFIVSGSNYYCEYGYIDSIGMSNFNNSSANTIDGYETAPYKELSSNRIMSKYFTMDPVKQATKDLTARSNANDWYYVDLSTADEKTGVNSVDINVLDYIPKPSSENKNIFFNKTKLNEDKPNMVTCTFGIQATDNSDTISGATATRCFNWVSKNYYDEYLWYRIKGTDTWTKVESFSSKDGTTRTDRPEKYQYDVYNRQRVVSTSNECFTSHKYILTGLTANAGTPVTYEYRCGRNEEQWSDIYEFTVRNNADAQDFGYIQVTDQQGFNHDEYVVWGKTAQYIENKEQLGKSYTNDETYDYSELNKNNTQNCPTVQGFHFILNTGDMTQNGNRLNEWLDYYSNGEVLYKKYEQMYIIGNNDLCPQKYQGFEALGDGGDISKINHINFQFFFTFEMDPNNLPFAYDSDNKSYFIPSLYSFNYGNTHFMAVNSEIVTGETGTEGLLYNDAVVYPYIRKWCEYDAEHIPSNTKFRIAFCHEQPFTILTNSVITKGPTASRGGSKLNTGCSDDYWFSRFLENYGFQLCMCGHKHTYSCTRNLRENYTYTWTGENKGTVLENGKEYNSLTTYLRDLVENGTITESETKNITFGSIKSMVPIIERLTDYDEGIITSNSSLWDSENNTRSKYNAPVYAMCQASGYKQTSNKELPGEGIPWLRNYFACTVKSGKDTANAGQKYPFYIKWNVNTSSTTNRYIRGDTFKLGNVMKSGKFNINSQTTADAYRIKANGSSNDSIIISTENTVGV